MRGLNGKWLVLSLIAVLLMGCARGNMLIDGPELQQWIAAGEANWRYENAELVADGAGEGFLMTRSSYKDFRLNLEFWIDETTNSGVFVRCQDRANIHPETCFEVNIWDNHPQQDARTGAIVLKVMPPLQNIVTVGRWNTMDITAEGQKLVVRVNSQITALMDRADTAPGFIALQHWEKGTVRFRNIQVLPI
ncbi:3-keto-disaccharide hydrolase [Candidatus Litorirhabdus singularis]|nr:DUF1080 domain-containing protein [Candidatus Litorirhabdus singularis]